MGCEQTPRRARRSWGQATHISVRDALLSSGRDLSVVSEAESVIERADSIEDATDPSLLQCHTPSIAWELPAADFRSQRPDPTIVSSLSRPSNRQTQHRRKNNSTAEAPEKRRNRRTWSTSSQETSGRLTGLKARVRGAPDPAMVKRTPQIKHDVKKTLSAARARQRVLKTRREEFSKTIHLLDSKCSAFRRASPPDDTLNVSEEEACIIEVQRTAFDRWEKAVGFAKQALEEVMEAEKVLGYAAEFDQLKSLMDNHGSDWDVGIDKYIDLCKDLQTEYPETVPIRRSKISRRQSLPRPVEKKLEALAPRSDGAAQSATPSHSRSRSVDEKSESSPSFIPSCSGSHSATQRFDPSHILTLGRRFAHSAETWFLKLIHSMVGIEVSHSIYCREDCYRLMESLSKLQNWLLNAKGTTRLDRHEVLLTRLRDTVIRWSSQMFELPLAKSSG